MKKFYTLLTAMAFTGLAATAGDLPLGTPFSQWNSPVEGDRVTSANMVCFEWEDMLHFVANQEIYFTLQLNDETPEKYSNGTYSYDWWTLLGSSYYWDTYDEAQKVYFTFNYQRTPGTYTLTIPAGILENSAGEKNQEQSLTFYVVGSLESSNAIIAPAESVEKYDYDTGTYSPVPFYKASALQNVTVAWEGISLQGTGTGSVMASGPNNVNITESVSVKDNQICLNLSELTDGRWTVVIPNGFVSGKDAEDNEYTNLEINLTYIIQNESSPLTNVEMTSPSSTLSTYFDMAQFNFGQPIMLKENAPQVTLSKSGSEFVLRPSIMVQGGSYNLRVSSSIQINTPGVYTLTIPAGVVTNGEYDNEIITKTFTILNYDENYTVTPENKSKVSTEELGKIVITFPNATNITALTENWRDIELSINSGSSIDYTTLKLNQDVKINGKSLEITIPNIKQYKYNITIPAMDFQLSETTVNYSIYLSYEAWDGMSEATVLEAPLARNLGSAEIELTWDYQALTLADNPSVKLAYGYYSDDVIPVPANLIQLKHADNPESTASSSDNNALYLNLTDVIKDYMESVAKPYVSFTLTIPAGIVTNSNGQMSPEAEFSFRVFKGTIPTEMQFVETDIEGVYVMYWPEVSWMTGEFFDNLTLTGDNDVNIVLTYDDSYSTTMSTLQPGQYMKDSYSLEDGNSTYAIYVNLNLDLDGLFNLNVPEGFVWVDLGGISVSDVINAAASIPVELGNSQTGAVDEIQKGSFNDGILRVYNLQGVNVMNAKDSSALKSLAPGIYIINGKKVALGK